MITVANLEHLQAMGFQFVGYWELTNEGLNFTLSDLSNTQNILYAFVCGGDIKYVGKTVQSLKNRMSGYKNPGPTQNTNIRVNKLILEKLKSGIPVNILAFFDNGLLQYGGFHVNLTAGLEDSIISSLQPEWNVTGKK